LQQNTRDPVTTMARVFILGLLCLSALVSIGAIPTLSRDMDTVQRDAVEEEMHKTFMDWKAKVCVTLS